MNKTIFAVTLIVTNIATFTVSKMLINNKNATTITQESPYLNLVQSFYEAINTPPSENTTQMLSAILAPEWTTNPPLSYGNGIEGMIKTLGTQYNTIPNIKTNIQEVISSGDRIIVRSTITGTPNGEFMGINTNSSTPFEITSIDIHTIKDGKIIDTQRSADWSIAVNQLKASNNAAPVSMAITPAIPVNQEQPQTPATN